MVDSDPQEVGMTWDDQLKECVRARWSVGETFTLEEVYQLEAYFSGLYPNNQLIPEKLRQTLQHLRDEGFLDFVNDQGTYKRLR
jgi:hypothetical protein